MSNSSLVNYTKLSPNHSGTRTHSIDRITPHCVVGQCSVETLGNIFAPSSKDASCNYGIGYDGRILLCVEEKNRSWCSSSNSNDQRAVTIECASDTYAPYTMNDKVYNSLVKLCTDICKRNGKKKLIWFDSESKTLNYSPKSDEMVITVHRWFANKSCPGDWLYSRLGNLANSVTKNLGGTATNSTSSNTNSGYSNSKIKYSSAVKTWQHAMNVGFDFEGSNLSEDGLFGSASTAFAKNHVLYQGMNSRYNCPTAIKWLQSKIGATQDGIFGKDTYNKLVAYQRKNSLTTDGECGLNTTKKLLGV